MSQIKNIIDHQNQLNKLLETEYSIVDCCSNEKLKSIKTEISTIQREFIRKAYQKFAIAKLHVKDCEKITYEHSLLESTSAEDWETSIDGVIRTHQQMLEIIQKLVKFDQAIAIITKLTELIAES